MSKVWTLASICIPEHISRSHINTLLLLLAHTVTDRSCSEGTWGPIWVNLSPAPPCAPEIEGFGRATKFSHNWPRPFPVAISLNCHSHQRQQPGLLRSSPANRQIPLVLGLSLGGMLLRHSTVKWSAVPVPVWWINYGKFCRWSVLAVIGNYGRCIDGKFLGYWILWCFFYLFIFW